MRSQKAQEETIRLKPGKTSEQMSQILPPHHGKGRIISRLNRWLFRTWWTHPQSIQNDPLYPLYTFAEALYARLLAVEQARLISRSRGLPRPVISIGNLVVGGTGKTPMALWMGRQLQAKGLNVTVLSGGYGGAFKGVSKVEVSLDLEKSSSLYGDEPTLMAGKGLPVWVGKDRFLAGKEALKRESSPVFLLDDGFQHLGLQRNLDLVLLDALNPWGNGLLLPFGPLREPLKNLERADAFILTRTPSELKKPPLASFLEGRFPLKPVFSCHHRLTGFRRGLTGEKVPLEALRTSPVVAFSGIAKPFDFLRSLQSVGINPYRYHSFPDHHAYQIQDLEMIIKSYEEADARFILTTEKDYVRLPPFPTAPVLTAEASIDFQDDTEPFMEFLQERIGRMLIAAGPAGSAAEGQWAPAGGTTLSMPERRPS